MDSEGNHGHGAYTKLRPDGDMEFHGFVIPKLEVNDLSSMRPITPMFNEGIAEEVEKYEIERLIQSMNTKMIKENRRCLEENK